MGWNVVDIKSIGVGIIIGIVGMFGVFAYFYDNEAVEGADVLIEHKTESIPCKQIEVYKPPVKKLAKLPKSILSDPSLYLTALIRTPNDGHIHKVSAVYDSKDGRVTLHDYPEPLKWIDFDKDQYMIAADYGFINSVAGVETGYQITARYNRIAFKGLNVGVSGSYRSDKSGIIGIGFNISF